MKTEILQMNGKGSEQTFIHSELLKEQNILGKLPIAVYICDADGVIVNYNQKAEEYWGRAPKKGDKDERFCGAYKLYKVDGEFMPHAQTPVAGCLADGVPVKDKEVVIERPDRSRIIVRVNIEPIKDDKGATIGMVNCFYDITEEKKTQEALHKKTTELQDYVENATIGLHWVDVKGNIKWANKAELDMLGYTAEEYIGHHISEFHAEPEKITDILRRLYSNETLINYESVLRCKDGSLKNVQISSNVFQSEGRFIHTRCFTVDVTEQKQLFNALKESEARYKSLVNTLPAAIYTCDSEGRITYFNDRAVQLWGYRPDINDNSLRFCACFKVWLMDGTYVPPDKTPMALAIQKGQRFRNVEALFERPDGSRIYASVNIDPLFDEKNNVIGAINVFQDITYLKKTEMALRESEAQHRRLVHSLETPLYTTDSDGRITLYNTAASELWGRKPELGKDLWCGSYKIFNTDGSELPLEECPMAVCLREQRPVYGEEILVVRPDGTLRNVAPHPQPLFDEAGNMTGAINMLVDITDIKQTEKALRESEKKYRELAASLECMVEEKTRKLEEYTAKLEFQNKELEQFAYAASHDMKEPLRKIHLYNSSISDNASNMLDEKSRDYLNRSIKAAKRMSELIDNLLAYSQTAAASDCFEKVDINDVIEEISTMHKEEFEHSKVTIESDKLPAIHAIPFQVKQLMFNLINNSIKYRHPGRNVQIKIKTGLIHGNQVEKELDPSSLYHRISIIDNGIGFDPKYAEKIFNIFQRLNNLPGAKGSGVGLAICKRIMQNHHGFIKASSKDGEGAVFDIYFPCASGRIAVA